jgi:hypothetical protein
MLFNSKCSLFSDRLRAFYGAQLCAVFRSTNATAESAEKTLHAYVSGVQIAGMELGQKNVLSLLVLPSLWYGGVHVVKSKNASVLFLQYAHLICMKDLALKWSNL